MLIREYADYLRNRQYSKYSVSVYSGRLQRFLNQGYSEADLKGAVDQLIRDHSKGGVHYDPKDHGNTVAALKRLKEMLLEGYLKDLVIAYERGYASFAPMEQHMVAYAMQNGQITVTYNTGKKETKAISLVDYMQLAEILQRYEDCLSDSDTEIKAFHGPLETYRYTIGKHSGHHCAGLFDKKRGEAKQIAAASEYAAWMEKYIN